MTHSSTFSFKGVVVFLKRLSIFGFFAILGIIATLFISGFFCKEGRLGTTYIKHERLESLDSPKVVMIGGSNLQYGMNSKMLEDSLGISVVNMGVQQSVGLKYMYDEVKDHLYQNDILLILVETPSYMEMPLEGMTNIPRIVSIYPRGIRYLNARQYYNSAVYIGPALMQNYRDMETVIRRKIKGKPTFYEQCDKWGDFHGHKDQLPTYKPKKRHYAYERDYKNGLEPLVASMIEAAEEKGFHVLISFSPSAASNSDAEFFGYLQTRVPDEIRISNMADYIFPDSFFYDSPDHLIYEKRDMRTLKLIEDLRAYRDRTSEIDFVQ